MLFGCGNLENTEQMVENTGKIVDDNEQIEDDAEQEIETTVQIEGITKEEAKELVQNISESELDNIIYQGEDRLQQSYRFRVDQDNYQDIYLVRINSGEVILEEDRYRFFFEPFIIDNKEIIINEDMEGLLDLLGKPSQEKNISEDNAYTYYFFEYEGLNITYKKLSYINEETYYNLLLFEVTNSNISTYRGISIGNKSEDIKNKYGNPDYDYLREDNRILSYLKSGGAFWFELKDDKVIKFGISHENQ